MGGCLTRLRKKEVKTSAQWEEEIRIIYSVCVIPSSRVFLLFYALTHLQSISQNTELSEAYENQRQTYQKLWYISLVVNAIVMVLVLKFYPALVVNYVFILSIAIPSV